jgi:hypothetical protein
VNLRIILMAIGTTAACAAQNLSDRQIANRLASENTRSNAVAKVVAAGNARISVLLAWTQKPPLGVDEYELDIGLADAFAQLGTKEAIPFLIKNIGLNRWRDVNVWLKTPKVIQERLPAVNALISLGPEALNRVIQAYWQMQRSEDRLAAVFVVSRIAAASEVQDPEARNFLTSTITELNIERFWAEEGLKSMTERH